MRSAGCIWNVCLSQVGLPEWPHKQRMAAGTRTCCHWVLVATLAAIGVAATGGMFVPLAKQSCCLQWVNSTGVSRTFGHCSYSYIVACGHIGHHSGLLQKAECLCHWQSTRAHCSGSTRVVSASRTFVHCSDSYIAGSMCSVDSDCVLCAASWACVTSCRRFATSSLHSLQHSTECSLDAGAAVFQFTSRCP